MTEGTDISSALPGALGFSLRFEHWTEKDLTKEAKSLNDPVDPG